MRNRDYEDFICLDPVYNAEGNSFDEPPSEVAFKNANFLANFLG
jgi:hypothetical protein